MQVDPLNAIGHGQSQCRIFRLKTCGYFVEHGVHVQFLVLGKTTPQTRAAVQAGGTITRATQTPVGGIAQTEITASAKVAMATRQVLFQGHQVAFFDAPLWAGNGTHFLHIAHSLVAQNGGALNFREVLEKHPITAAHARDFNLQQARIWLGIGRLKLLNFDGAIGHGHSSFECLSHE